MCDVRIRKVSILQGRCKRKTEEMDLDPNDLVIVRTSVSEEDPLPTYELEKIEGAPISYLFDKVKEGCDDSE